MYMFLNGIIKTRISYSYKFKQKLANFREQGKHIVGIARALLLTVLFTRKSNLMEGYEKGNFQSIQLQHQSL